MKTTYQFRNGHERTKFSHKNSSFAANERRKVALEQLQEQLKRGTKPEKSLHPLTLATTGGNDEPLTEKDIKRIRREMDVLKERIK